MKRGSEDDWHGAGVKQHRMDRAIGGFTWTGISFAAC
jgi:hypothetical protein